ncbi:MAG TPA: hypothetical protein VHA71_05960, partial [Rhodanobacteraceae bacterium]|nr:hypothetical protein [Rhodanobacteraceae bacterium]
GKPGDSLAELKPLVNGSELCVTHVAMMNAYTDVHDNTGALVEAHWLSAHRGRAYVESNMQLMLAPFNVAVSDLALLRLAELSSAMGNETASHESLAAFEAAWPKAEAWPWLATRLSLLKKQH